MPIGPHRCGRKCDLSDLDLRQTDIGGEVRAGLQRGTYLSMSLLGFVKHAWRDFLKGQEN